MLRAVASRTDDAATRIANMFGVAIRVAASSVLLATALSIGTVWIWLSVLP